MSLFVAGLLLAAAVPLGLTAAYLDLKGSSTGGGPGTVKVVDDLGRTVSVPTNPSRVVVLAPSILDIVVRLHLRSDVVAIGCTPSAPGGILSEYTPNQTAAWSLSASDCITDYPLSDEWVANVNPTLVLASTLTSAADVDTLSTTYHIPVVLLAPSSVAGIFTDVEIVASIFPGAQAAAQSLESEMEATLANATSFDAQLEATNATIPSVLLTYYFDPGGYWSYGAGAFGDSLVTLAGGSSLASGLPLLYPEVNATAALDEQPSVVLYGTSWNDVYVVYGETPTNWTSAPYWSQLTGQKIAVDVTLVTEADPTMLFELPWLMHWLHPTLAPTP